MARVPAGKPIGERIAGFWGGAAASGRLAILEVSVGYGLILVALWTPLAVQRGASWAALAWIAVAVVRSRDRWGAMGLGLSGSLRSLWLVGVALVLAVSAVLLSGAIHATVLPDFLRLLLRRYWTYALWAFLQQFVLMDFVLLRLLQLLPPRKAIAVAAGLFAIAHLPNPVLTPLTLLWGLAACILFLHYRNLYTLAVAHIIFGVCIAIAVPGPIDHNMRVGLGYLTYRPHPHHHQRSQNDQTVSTVAWVMAEAPSLRSFRQARP